MQAALESALTVGAVDGSPALRDPRAEVERVVIAREEVRRIGTLARRLTADQRLVLAAQLSPDPPTCAEFCARHGWSAEKYRKVSQRARTRLRMLMSRDDDAAPGRVPAASDGSVQIAGTTYGHRNTT